MKKELMTVLALGLALCLAAFGCTIEPEESEGPPCVVVVGDSDCDADADADADADSDTDSDTDADTDEGLPCPFKADGPYNINVQVDYVLGYGNGKGCVKLVGDPVGTPGGTGNWLFENGLVLGDDNNDGYVGMVFTPAWLTAGEYRFSYIGAISCDSSSYYWADYGVDREDFQKMTAECRRYIECNSESCALKIRVDGRGNITPAGNQ